MSTTTTEEKRKTFVQWLTTETIGVVVLTSIVSFSVQDTIRSLQVLYIAHGLSNQRELAFNPMMGIINHTSVHDELKAAGYPVVRPHLLYSLILIALRFLVNIAFVYVLYFLFVQHALRRPR